MTVAIRVEGLTKTYRGGTVRALDGVSFTVAAGETLGIIGPNGAGKTTLLGCLLGFLRPDDGTIEVEGNAPDDLAVRATTGYLPERLVLDRWMQGLDFLRYHHALAALPAATRETDCRAAFERVGLDAAAARQRIGRYSRGMVQRLGFAQALLGAPRLLFLDEPISGVDPAGVLLFRRLLAELSQQGVTVLVNSHQLAEVERVCTRVVFVEKGRLTATDTLRAGAAQARVLRVRLATSDAAPPPPSALAELARASGATFRDWTAPDARFHVADDAAVTRLLAALLAANVPVIEAGPEEGRLERLFAGPQDAPR
jgi:ABC-type multidrug transport system ATPase subunit